MNTTHLDKAAHALGGSSIPPTVQINFAVIKGAAA